MRKLIVVGVLAAVAIAVLAVPAFASFDRHQRDLEGSLGTSHPERVRVQGQAPRPTQPPGVGRVRGKCRIRQEARKIRCHAVVHLNGKIGGFGDIRLSGDLGPGDRRVNVVGGTADFNGVAGKMLIRSLGRNTDKLHFDLVR